jgi:hypothetical protein
MDTHTPKKSFFVMGFIWTDDSSFPIPLCLVCGEQLTNATMTPAKLKRQLTTNHSHMTSTTAEYSEQLLESQNKQSKAFVSKVTVSERAQEYCREKEKSHSWLKTNNSSM